MKEIARKGLKPSSIRFRLHFLAFLLGAIMSGLFLSLSLNEMDRSFSAMNTQAFQTAESYLTTMEYIVTSLKNTSFFPVNYTIYNDSSLLKPLRNGTFQKDFLYRNKLNILCKTHLKDTPLDFMIVYDLYGNGIGIDTIDIGFTDCHIRGEPQWYCGVSDRAPGEVRLYGPDEFAQSGYVKKDKTSVCAVRSMVDPLTWKVIGVAAAGIDLNTLRNSFYQIMTFEGQEVAVYAEGTFLFGIGEWRGDPDETSAVRQYKIRFDSGSLYLENYVSHGGDITVAVRTPMHAFFHLYSFVPLFGIALILFLFLWIIRRLIHGTLNSLQKIVEACNDFANQTIPVLSADRMPPELQGVVHSFNRMASRVNTLIHDVLMKTMEKQETELQLLRTQINPHYLYNTLEIMHMTAYRKKDYKVAAMAEYLGKNLQYGLRNTNWQVTLEEEFRQLDIYLALLGYQYEDFLKVNFHVDKQLFQCRVLKLMFQPVVENAVLHGFRGRGQVLTVEIFGFREEDKVHFTVSDDGLGIDKETLKHIREGLDNYTPNKIGIYNLNRRFQIMYGPEYGLTIDSIRGQGTKVELTLPFETE